MSHIHSCRAILLVSALLGTALQVQLLGGVAFAAGCPGDQMTETGVCTDSEVVTLTPDQQAQLAAKDAGYQDLYQQIVNQESDSSSPCCGGGGGSYQMPEVVNMTIFKEGEGNNGAYWTCGPSATRNMVAAMWKHKYGAYKDFGEHQFEVWEHTTRDGTSSAEIRDALNAHFSQFGSWITYRPPDRDHYLSSVATDTYQYHQPVIVNVQTGRLPFWNGHSVGHFDIDYGWDSTDPAHRYISIGEEWDPIYLFGHSDYGNPYGKHPNTMLLDAFQAEDVVSYHYMIV